MLSRLMTTAILVCNWKCHKLLLNNWHRNELILTAHFFSNKAGILSGPVALSLPRAFSTAHTSSSVNAMSEMVVTLEVQLSRTTKGK